MSKEVGGMVGSKRVKGAVSARTFTWTINNREITAGPLATAFMCLFQTLFTLENVAQRGIRDKLNRLYTIHTRSTESVKN